MITPPLNPYIEPSLHQSNPFRRFLHRHFRHVLSLNQTMRMYTAPQRYGIHSYNFLLWYILVVDSRVLKTLYSLIR